MKAVKDEARRQVQALVKELGFDDVPALKAHLAGTRETDDDGTKRPPAAATTTNAQEAHEQELEEARIESALRESLLDAGVRRRDLDFAVSRFVARVRDLDDDALKTYDVPDFVKELATDVPMVFVEGKAPKAEPTAEERKAAEEAAKKATEDAAKAALEAKAKEEADAKAAEDKRLADEAAAKAGTAKTGTDAAQPGGRPKDPPPFDAMKATKAELDAKWAHVKTLRDAPPVLDKTI